MGPALSSISLDVADTLSDTLPRDHSRFFADGIAVPMPGSNTTRPSVDATERTGTGLKNRADQRLSWVRGKGTSPTPASTNDAPMPCQALMRVNAGAVARSAWNTSRAT
jgi:hypothetical protein